MAPNTWLKWYVFTEGGGIPLYFKFVGIIRGDGSADLERNVVIETWHGLVLHVNKTFLDLLLPLDPAERVPVRVVREQKSVEKTPKPKDNMRVPVPAQAAVALTDDQIEAFRKWRDVAHGDGSAIQRWRMKP